MTLLDTYLARVNSGHITPDPAQQKAAQILSEFGAKFDVVHSTKRTFFFKKRGKTAIQNLYVWGGVGRGKTMLMDMLVASIKNRKVKRVHFHAFMQEVHAQLKGQRNSKDKTNPLTKVAKNIAATTELLCFDEFHVNDIADAMILATLTEALNKEGVSLILTSNYPPDDLYKNGLQRARFLPFIAYLKAHSQILHLDSPTDYRLRALAQSGTWFAPLTDASWSAMNALFETLTANAETPRTSLDIDGRALPILRAFQKIAWCDFKTLCVDARGAADYLALAKAYDVIFIDEMRHLNEHTRNEARRFMTLIDTLYDNRCVLVMRASNPPQQTYSGTTHHFEYERTISRLLEMQSTDWFSSNFQGKLPA